jgi:hypothetical protein
MPDVTPNRGYPFPLYVEPTMDFPTASEDLAVAVDADMSVLEPFILNAYDRPSARIFSSVAQSIPNNAATAVSWLGGTTDYDNGAMSNLIAGGGLNLTERGVYELSACITIVAPAAGGTFGLQLAFVSTGGFITTPAAVTVRAHPTQDTWLALSALHYHTGVGTDAVSLQIWHNQGAPRSSTFRQMTATKTSNTVGGS